MTIGVLKDLEAAVVKFCSCPLTFVVVLTVLIGTAEVVKPHRSEVVSNAVDVVISLQIHGPCWKYFLPRFAADTVDGLH